MNLQEIYAHPDYIRIADEVEQHSRAIARLAAELRIKFPNNDGRSWVVMGNHRPYLMSHTGFNADDGM